MKTKWKITTLVGGALLVWGALAFGGQTSQDKMKEIDRKVEALLKKMTLEEKIGQMTQVTIGVVSRGPGGTQEPHGLDSARVEEAILRYHVGSILNVANSHYTVSHWHEIITHIQDVATRRTRLGIPILYGIDAVHGANYTTGATIFPQSIAIAATWDPEIARRIGEITAYEIRACGIPWNFHPVLDLGRQPLWPRFWETYGEDVTLAKTFGASYVGGLMGDDMAARDKVAPCLKHFAGYSFPINGKDRTPAWIDERMMREYFLPPFEAAVKSGVPTVMINSSEVNGIPGHANYHLMTEVLKGEWKFKGFIVSDWEDIKRLHTRDHVADSPAEAVRMSVMAGVDMSMVPNDFTFYDLLLQLVREKAVPMARIDDAVRRILRVKYLVGLFDRPYPDASMQQGVARPEFTEFNRRVASNAITLLKNSEEFLPLRKGVRVLVTGPTANSLSALNSGWTITWQGDSEASYPNDKPTILGALRAKLGVTNVAYAPGSGFSDPIDIEGAAAAADTADVVIACLGERAYCETPGNINDLTLDDAQLRLVEAIAKKGKPIVLVLAEGRPRLIHRIVEAPRAILMAYLPGMEGGIAVADVLFGDAQPGGRLPFSYPKYPNGVTLYDCKPIELYDGNTYDPEFPFGYGLDYTTYEYSDLHVAKDVFTLKDDLKVSVSVRNTGKRPGQEVVQLYISDLYRTISPPVRELKAFKKVDLRPGESRTVEFALRPDDLSFVGKDFQRVVEKGKFRVAVSTLSHEVELR